MNIEDLRQIAGDIQTYAKIEEIQDKLPGMARNIIEASKRDVSGLDKLAVVPLELGGNIDSREADTLAQILSIKLIGSGKYAVYPRTATLEQVRAEYNTQMSGMTADKNMADVGRGSNPAMVLSVTARKLGSLNMFNAAIIDLESGVQTMGKSENYNDLGEGIEVMDKLAQALTGVEISGTDALPGTSDTSDLDAVRSAARAQASGKTGRGVAAFGYGALNLVLGLGSFIEGDTAGGVVTLLSYGAAAGLIGWELSLGYDDQIAGIPGVVGLGVAGFAVVYGFVRPFLYEKNHRLAALMDGVRLAALPAKHGVAALLYSVKF